MNNLQIFQRISVFSRIRRNAAFKLFLRDALRRALPATWRSRLIKVAATVITTTRRVIVQLAGGWPFLELYRAITQRAQAAPAGP